MSIGLITTMALLTWPEQKLNLAAAAAPLCFDFLERRRRKFGRGRRAIASWKVEFSAIFCIFPVTVKLWKTERNSKNGLPKWDALAPFHRLHQLTFKSSNLIQNRRPRARFWGRESLKESVKSWIRSIQLIRNGLKFRKRRQKVFKPQFDQGKTITNILQQILPTTQL